MPEPPAHNSISADAPSLPPVLEEEGGDTIAFLPPLVSRILIASWVLLFSARWLIIEALIAVGFFGPDDPRNTDRIQTLARIDTKMGQYYLFLWSITLVILVLRIARSLRPAEHPAGSKMDFKTQAGAVSDEEATGRAEMSDRGGKKA